MVSPGREAVSPRAAGAPAAADEHLKRELARELHDQVVQELTTMLIDLENFKHGPIDAQRTVRQVDSIQGSLRLTLGRMRNLLYGLRDEQAWELDFVPSLRVYAIGCRARIGLRVQVRVGRDWPARIRRRPAQHLARIVQEAITNSHRHGRATSVRVGLRVTERGVATLTVRDDGRGLPSEAAASGLGIVGMRERAVLLGGTLAVQGQPGGGVQVRLAFPARSLT